MTTTTSTNRDVPATGHVRALADRLDVELDAIEGTGVGGRIRPADVRAAADRRFAAQTAFTPSPAAPDDGWFPGCPTPVIEP